jgi:lipid-A-disaccharide synthase-like uncharacterized protein
MNPAEILGFIGGILFFLSWILQAWETRRKGYPIVTLNFFILRFIGSVLLLIEAIRVASIGLIIVTGGTMLVIIYNVYVIMYKKSSPIDL